MFDPQGEHYLGRRCFDPTLPVIQGFTGQQLATVEQNTALIEEREKEIQSIVQSISEINEMYRDLASMVVEQVRAHSYKLGIAW